MMDANAVNERKVFPRAYVPFSSSLNSTVRVFQHVKRELRYNSDEGGQLPPKIQCPKTYRSDMKMKK